jgi:uncharacterized iron-regulated protein
MNNNRYISAYVINFLITIILLGISGCASLPERYVALEDHTFLSLNEVLEQIENDRVIFVGEIHDAARDHLVQFEVIKHLHGNGKKVAIAFELFPSSKQDYLDSWIEGDLSGYDFQKKYYSLWDYYSKILKYSREEHIPVIGINAEKALIANVSKKGPKVLSENSRKKFRYIACSEDDDYAMQLRFGREMDSHTSSLPFLCDGQRLRDAIMAYNIASFLKENGFTMVVLTGVAHASKVAVPRMLQEHIDVSYKVLIPDSVKVIIKREPDISVADYKWR